MNYEQIANRLKQGFNTFEALKYNDFKVATKIIDDMSETWDWVALNYYDIKKISEEPCYDPALLKMIIECLVLSNLIIQQVKVVKQRENDRFLQRCCMELQSNDEHLYQILKRMQIEQEEDKAVLYRTTILLDNAVRDLRNWAKAEPNEDGKQPLLVITKLMSE